MQLVKLVFQRTTSEEAPELTTTVITYAPITFPDDRQSYNYLYQIFMLDLSIPDIAVSEDNGYALVPGIAANDTTRLHWWQGTLTVSPEGFLVNHSIALAPWNIPEPEGTAEHYYMFWLFAQPKGWMPSQEILDGLYFDTSADSRYNFSMLDIANQVGEPLAGNYFRALESD
ncbi:hypothetical protein N7493_003320 [Penicillium malachiteum]|uniref:Uncharacterized protein n=1 Tax=Penicillium malachiteum TaxID=1324776 RepID=A0AAD6MXN9_9EURO|nr:hypothetical protein N7493_003320 [Penicillium malachiteum]